MKLKQSEKIMVDLGELKEIGLVCNASKGFQSISAEIL